MRGRQVVIVAAIVVGFLASLVASLVTDVQWHATPAGESPCARALKARGQGRLVVQTDGRSVSAVTIVQLKSRRGVRSSIVDARPQGEHTETAQPSDTTGPVHR
jgi:hypothetical protein